MKKEASMDLTQTQKKIDPLNYHLCFPMQDIYNDWWTSGELVWCYHLLAELHCLLGLDIHCC